MTWRQCPGLFIDDNNRRLFFQWPLQTEGTYIHHLRMLYSWLETIRFGPDWS